MEALVKHLHEEGNRQAQAIGRGDPQPSHSRRGIPDCGVITGGVLSLWLVNRQLLGADQGAHRLHYPVEPWQV